MSMTWGEIVAIMQARRRAQSPLITKMIEVKRRYNAEWVMPLPNIDEEPDTQNYGPALIADAVEHLSLKAASVYFGISVPALDPTKTDRNERGSVAWADIRRKAYAGTLFRNQARLKVRQMFKHWTGYATFSALWMPDLEKNEPVLLVRDPLTSFPEPKSPTDISAPRNIGFIAAQSADYIISKYPEAATLVRASRTGQSPLWDMVEWIDEDDIVLGILGPHEPNEGRQDWTTGGFGYNTTGFAGGNAKELRRWPNRAGVVPGVCPMQITMDKVASAIAKNIGQSDLMAKLTALDILATEKAIFPDRYVIGKTGQVPQIVGNRWKDGREGETNIILDAEKIGLLHNSPDPSNKQAIDRAERNYRISTGLVPQAGGETYGALRTGRGMDSLEASAVDPRIQEMQEVMEFSMTSMLRSLNHMYVGYWPNKQFSMYSGWPGDQGHVKFTPSKELAESDENVVSYPILGTDAQTLTIRLAQLLGSKALSLRTFRKKHPDIDDAEAEERQVWIEAFQDACLQVLIQLVSGGSTPPEDLAKIGQALQGDNDVFAALLLASDLAQQRQAEQAPPPEQGQLGPGGGQLALPPGAQPGLGAPGAGMENQPPQPPIGPPPPSLDNLRRLTRDVALRPAG